MIRLLLADDRAVVRRGLRKRLSLEPDLEVVGEASNGREAVSRTNELLPDIVLMDIEMPEMDGISAAAAIRATSPRSAVIMLSIYDDAASRVRAREAGAVEFVEKSAAIDGLVATIRRVAEQNGR